MLNLIVTLSKLQSKKDMKTYTFFSYGLLIACPFKSELPNCPLAELRKLAMHKRVEKINEMTSQELIQLELFHIKCQDSRKKLLHT